MHMAARTVNDFTIRVATVNGSGSQSSNLVLTNAIFKLGVPVAPKNVFPSNIEGLPTWFDVRVTSQGYRCRTRDVDVLVALNAATWENDVAGVKPGGAVIHESTYALTGQTQRADLTYYAVPFAALAKEHFSDKGDLRKYLMNMIYVGVLAALLEIPLETVEEGLRAQFRTKAAAVELNMNAARVGFDYARANLEKRDSYYLEPMTGKTEGYLFMEGNRAAALGCVMGGCTVAAWYPITPSSSLCEYFIQYCDRYRTENGGERKVAIVQAEDELAAAGVVFGAGWAGARAMTSTSGPGISLMAEYAGYGYFAEVPGVIFDVQRAGPSTGLPTRTMQGDVAFAYTLSHGDTKHIVLLPATVREAYEFAMEAFDLADRFQTPVFVLSDLDLGMNSWLTKPLSYPKKPYDRGKVLSADDLSTMKAWGRYRDVDKDGITYRTLPGTKHPNAGFFTRGTGHDEEARYSEQPDVWQRNLDRLLRKLETARTSVPAPVVDEKGNKVAILAYGTTHHAVVEARDRLDDAGIHVDYLRVRALPLSPEVATFVKRHERVYVVEQNRDGQLHGILRTELPTHLIGRLESICHYNGVPIDARAIFDPLLEAEREPAVVAE
jgi:2-oxoglutarate/2-oxoacid ferredoxin oxidoreductase subunit alpha